MKVITVPCLRSYDAVQKYRANLMTQHDSLADLKSYFDARKDLKNIDDGNLDRFITYCSHGIFSNMCQLRLPGKFKSCSNLSRRSKASRSLSQGLMLFDAIHFKHDSTHFHMANLGLRELWWRTPSCESLVLNVCMCVLCCFFENFDKQFMSLRHPRTILKPVKEPKAKTAPKGPAAKAKAKSVAKTPRSRGNADESEQTAPKPKTSRKRKQWGQVSILLMQILIAMIHIIYIFSQIYGNYLHKIYLSESMEPQPWNSQTIVRPQRCSNTMLDLKPSAPQQHVKQVWKLLATWIQQLRIQCGVDGKVD